MRYKTVDMPAGVIKATGTNYTLGEMRRDYHNSEGGRRCSRRVIQFSLEENKPLFDIAKTEELASTEKEKAEVRERKTFSAKLKDYQ